MAKSQQYLFTRDFMRSLQRIRNNTVHSKAVERVQAALFRASAGEDPFQGLQPTSNGESRIRNCIKYELQGRARLVTVQHSGQCTFVFVGDHDDVDRWLDRNRGHSVTIGANRLFGATFVSVDEASQLADTDYVATGLGELYSRLDDAVYDKLTEGLPNSKRRQLEKLDTSSSDSELRAIVGAIADEGQRKAIYDVFTLLRQDRLEPAKGRAELFLNLATKAEDASIEELEAALDSNYVRRIPENSVSFAEMIKQLTSSGGYKDWMLFLHPEQEKIVVEDFDGPAKLAGVSGSGKTCVVVRRAVRMAELYPSERILILTLNPALASLIDGLVEICAPEEARGRIESRSLFSVCRQLLLGFEPALKNTLDEVTWRTLEHIDAIWQEYYRCELNNDDARVFRPVHDTLLTRGWNPERYLREEVDWLRSAVGPFDREEYLTLRRRGRALPLTEQFRRAVLEGAEGWGQKMRDIGAVDLLGLVENLTKYFGRLSPIYRCILIDEGQDFGNAELSLVRRLVAPGPNDLFIAGDAAQTVSTKYQSFEQAQINIPRERSRRLSLNYRNSRDVLQASFAILEANLSDEMLDREDFEILQPELSSHQGNTPLLLQADDVADELSWALQHLRALAEQDPEWKGCVAVCGYSLHELQTYGKKVGFPVLDGTVRLDDGAIFLSDLEQTKGFEFNLVCIVNCSKGVLPDSAAPVDEQHRDLARFYVAMTRARTDLMLSWSEEPSPFVANVRDHFYAAPWSELVVTEKRVRVKAPRRLEHIREEGIHLTDPAHMSGNEFLYTPHALGLSAELLVKIRDLVDGQGLRKGAKQIKWKSMRAAVRDAQRDPRTRTVWGPEIHSQLLQLGSKMGWDVGK